jgi:hypothetical protein
MRAGVQARSRCQRKACAVSGVELATKRLLAIDLSGPDCSRAALGAGSEVLGRLYDVMIGIAPSTGGDALKIVIGGLLALAGIWLRGVAWKKFD